MRNLLKAAPLALALIAATGLGVSTAGCRVNEDDVHRWESTLHGPDKLQAVVKAPKYDTALRVEAAMSLIRMKPRGGRGVGIERLVDTLAEIAPEQRAPIMAGLVPSVAAELKKPPPTAQAGQPAPPDPSFAFKDAAYAMLTYEKSVLVSDDAQKAQLKQVLIEWAIADFERRLENRKQSYGMEQLLRYLGSESVVGLPKLINRDSRNLDKIAGLVADLGSTPTKEAASAALVEVSKHVLSDEWIKITTPMLEATNKTSGIKTDAEGFKGQLTQFQDEQLLRVLGSLRRVGGRPAVDFCLGLASDPKAAAKRRVAALAAVELRLDSKNPDDVKRIFDIAMSDAPAEVLDLAFARIGEMPRKDVVDRLYEAFKTDKWKVRRSAGMIVLRMSEVKDIEEFMGKLPGADAKGFAMSEAISFGAKFGDLKGGDHREVLKKFLPDTTPLASRTAAVSFYMTHGKAADLSTLTAFETDAKPVPLCETDPDCKWACYVPKAPAAPAPNEPPPKDPKPPEKELKDIKTFGEYVKLCVVPAIQERAEQEKKAEKK